MNQIANLYGLPTYDPTTGTTSTASTSVDPNASFYRSPDYNFDLSQGIKGVDAGAAARGLLDSGATRKAEIAYAGNLASGQYNTYADRLMKIAGIGQAAANNQASSGQSYANSYGDIITNAATNQGNAGLAGSNAVTSGINSATGSIQKYLNSLSQPNSSSIPLRR